MRRSFTLEEQIRNFAHDTVFHDTCEAVLKTIIFFITGGDAVLKIISFFITLATLY